MRKIFISFLVGISVSQAWAADVAVVPVTTDMEPAKSIAAIGGVVATTAADASISVDGKAVTLPAKTTALAIVQDGRGCVQVLVPPSMEHRLIGADKAQPCLAYLTMIPGGQTMMDIVTSVRPVGGRQDAMAAMLGTALIQGASQAQVQAGSTTQPSPR